MSEPSVQALSSSHLTRMIRTLVRSESSEERAAEQARIEQEHAQSRAAVERLIQVHQHEAPSAFTMLHDVELELSETVRRVARVHRTLGASRSTVKRRLTEVERLERDAAQHQAIIEALNELVECVETAGLPSELARRGDFAAAAERIARTEELLNGKFAALGALSELREQLTRDRIQLYRIMVERADRTDEQ